jgi:uncharacterized membrane protein required for colicin V production
MNSLINWFNNLSRNTRILLVVAVCLFTPAVSIAFTIIFGGISAVFSIIGFAFSMLNWKGVLFFFIVGMFFAAKAGYTWIMDEDEDDTTLEDDTFSW